MNIFLETDKKKVILLGLVSLVLIGLVIYVNILDSPFIFDDRITISENNTIKSLSGAFADTANSRYVGILSFALNYSLGELNVLETVTKKTEKLTI